jgi:hypothetical protein
MSDSELDKDYKEYYYEGSNSWRRNQKKKNKDKSKDKNLKNNEPIFRTYKDELIDYVEDDSFSYEGEFDRLKDKKWFQDL